jgi:hypothetical protein
MKSIKKQILVGGMAIEVTAEKIARPDHKVVIEAVARACGVAYREKWSLASNHKYSQDQAQIDFQKHCTKVATELAGRLHTNELVENLK